MKCLIVICSLLLVGGLLEISIRLFHLSPSVHRISTNIKKTAYRLSNNPVLGYEFKENYRDDNPDSHSTFSFTNSHGQRDIERNYVKKDGVKRILVLGDSVVAGHGIYDLNNTIPRYLEILLKNKNIEVLNLGVGGYSTRGEIELLKVKGIKYSPDLVIIIFVLNDFFDINSQIKSYGFNRPKIVESLFIYSHLFRLTSIRLNLFNFRSEMDPTFILNRHLDAFGKNNVEKGFEMLTELAEKHGFHTMILIWPSFLNDNIINNNKPSMVAKKVLYDDSRSLTIEKLAKKFGIASFRLSGFFHRDLNKQVKVKGSSVNPRKYYTIGDGMHPSEAGARVAAQAIMSILEKNPGFLSM